VLIEGAENLHQALLLAVVTDRGALAHHPQYGTWIYRYVGKAKTGLRDSLVAAEAIRSIEAEPRVRQVFSPSITGGQDTLQIQVDVLPISQPDPMVWGLDLPLGGKERTLT